MIIVRYCSEFTPANMNTVLRIYDRGTYVNNVKPHFKLLHELRGHKNQNWPIKSDFSNQYMSKSASDDSSTTTNVLLATGSADNNIRLFEVGQKEGKTELLQTLEGHQNIVYGVSFHPKDAVLASCSADAKIKIWKAKK